jgi:Contractile injection system spike tip protein
MSDFILQDGDIANFIPAFGPAIVVVQPGQLKASGPATTNGKKICLEGDESNVSVPGCMYMAGPFAIPGTGTLKIASLAPDQKTVKTKHKGKALMLKGGQFIAKFEVQSPAQQPSSAGPVPDPTPMYSGQGTFITTNIKIKSA